MSVQHDQHTIESDWDPVYLHARKEAALILGVWFLAFLWTVPFCYFNGYESQVAAEDISFIMGIPSWVFWGVGVPWLCCNVVTIWFCFWYFSEDNLEPPSQKEDNSGGQE